MSEYGVTDKGFVLKRLDAIMDEVHSDLTEGFGVDTRLYKPTFLNTLVMSFCSQIATLWETAQDSYYAKYPATATGVNLDNAVQYGGIVRTARKQSSYPLHCTGNDGTTVNKGTTVATNTNPEIRLQNAEAFTITREAFNKARVKVASSEIGVYTISLNGNQYSYSSTDGDEAGIIAGLAKAVTDDGYTVSAENNVLTIEDKTLSRSNVMILSDNLTTENVTVIATFMTEDYGRITLPNGIVTKMIDNVAGFNAVTNLSEPTYGRDAETDIELRHSYIAKSAIRSNTMIESIIGELLNNVDDVESASGYENDSDSTDERGLPPHSIEIIVEGGDNNNIAAAILQKKAGGIQTYGSVEVGVPANYGDTIPVRFNRPDYFYTWLKVKLHGDSSKLPSDYATLTVQSIVEEAAEFTMGTSLLTQLLTEGIYDAVAGLTYIDIYTAYSKDSTFVPEDADYKQENIIATSRQKILIDEKRIEVSFDADN